jgi:hypothetical protein
LGRCCRASTRIITSLARLLRIIEICYDSIKWFAKNLERNFKCAEWLALPDVFVFKMVFRHKLY